MERSALRERLRRNLAHVRATIDAACRRSGRQPAEVALLAITKYVEPDTIRGLLELGVRDFGENRVQQLAQRAECLGADLASPFAPRSTETARNGESAESAGAVPRWHMVGHLQRNKVRALLPHARTIHSLDSPRLAQELQRQAEKRDVVVDAFIEVNVAREASKTGAAVAQVAELAETTEACGRIRLRGLMTMAPFDPDPEAARPCFVRLRELLEQLRRSGVVGPTCAHLSMGMTQDYAVAVEEGATFVRIGSALYEGLG